MVKLNDFHGLECFSSTFQGKFNFQGLFKTVLYIQVLFKPVRNLSIPVVKARGGFFFCSTHVRMKFETFINITMPTKDYQIVLLRAAYNVICRGYTF